MLFNEKDVNTKVLYEMQSPEISSTPYVYHNCQTLTTNLEEKKNESYRTGINIPSPTIHYQLPNFTCGLNLYNNRTDEIVDDLPSIPSKHNNFSSVSIGQNCLPDLSTSSQYLHQNNIEDGLLRKGISEKIGNIMLNSSLTECTYTSDLGTDQTLNPSSDIKPMDFSLVCDENDATKYIPKSIDLNEFHNSFYQAKSTDANKLPYCNLGINSNVDCLQELVSVDKVTCYPDTPSSFEPTLSQLVNEMHMSFQMASQETHLPDSSFWLPQHIREDLLNDYLSHECTLLDEDITNVCSSEFSSFAPVKDFSVQTSNYNEKMSSTSQLSLADKEMERRLKNNQASRKSRAKRRQRFEAMVIEENKLIKNNKDLRHLVKEIDLAICEAEKLIPEYKSFTDVLKVFF